MSMTLTNDATLTWLWDTNFALSSPSIPAVPSPPATAGKLLGAVVELVVTASNDYIFAGWTGDTNAITAGAPSPASIIP